MTRQPEYVVKKKKKKKKFRRKFEGDYEEGLA